jgi:hypothetical protein
LIVEAAHFGAVEVFELLTSKVGLDVVVDDPRVSDVCAVLQLALIHQGLQVVVEPAVQVLTER